MFRLRYAYMGRRKWQALQWGSYQLGLSGSQAVLLRQDSAYPTNPLRKTEKGEAAPASPFLLNPVSEADTSRDLHVPRTRSFRALQTGKRAKPRSIDQHVRHVIIPMIERIRRLRPELKL